MIANDPHLSQPTFNGVEKVGFPVPVLNVNIVISLGMSRVTSFWPGVVIRR